MTSAQDIITSILEKDRVLIIPSTDLDSLLAAGVLMETLHELGRKAVIGLDVRSVKDNNDSVKLLIGFPSKPSYPDVLLLEKEKTHSITGLATFFTKNKSSNYYWFSVLSLIAGQYRGLDLGKEGFRDVEKSLLDELVEQDLVVSEFGFRLWGWGRKKLVNQVMNTLIPFLPGLTGDVEKATRLISMIPGVGDPGSATSHHVFSETEPERAKRFVQLLYDNLDIDPSTRKDILYRLIGYVYMIGLGKVRIDSPSVMGSLLVYMVLGIDNPVKIPLIAFDQMLLNHVLSIYEKYIDVVAVEAGMSVMQVLSGSNVVETDYITRPELIIDALDSIGKLPDKPVLIKHVDRGEYTVARELLRAGYDWDYVLENCDGRQLCSVG